jgi:hypothetical protein
MEDFSVLQVQEEQGEVTEVLEMDHQLIFSSTTSEVATAASGEPAVLVEHSTQQVAITTVNYNHTENHGNGNSALEASQGGVTEVSYGDGEALIGRSVVKKFSRKKYIGRIVAYDPNTRWYKVVYEDGDEEELEWKELEPILVPLNGSLPAASKKRSRPASVTGAKEKSPAKRPRGRPPLVGKVKPPAKLKTPKKIIRIPKALKVKTKEGRTQKPGKTKTLPVKKGQSPVKEGKQRVAEVSGTISTAKKTGSPQTQKAGPRKVGRPKKAGTRNVGRPKKAGPRKVGRPKKAESIEPQLKRTVGRKRKPDVKDGGDSSSEIKPSTRRSSLVTDQDVSISGAKAGAKEGAKAGASLIGRKTKKKFGTKYFGGEVIGFDTKANFYKVRYEDGDEEELVLKEVERTLVVEEQLAAAKTRRQASKSNGLGSPLKKQKVVSPKKDAGKRKSPTQPQRKGAIARRRGRPSTR